MVIFKGLYLKKMFLLFSHQLTPKQKDDAINSLKVEELISLPPDLQELWSNIPPEIEDLDVYLKPIFNYLKENLKSGDYALVQGDFGATCKVANFIKELNAIAVYATTKRDAIEKIVDGKVVKTSTFEHIRFRRFK